MSARRAQLWADLRLLVLDLETAVAPDGSHRIVSAAAVTCLSGKAADTWSAPRVNPGVPIDPVTSSIHKLTDADVRDAPAFPALVPELLALLTPGPSEQLVLVAHKARFDLPILRAELERAGSSLPDLAVIDTMGRLRRVAGVAPLGGSLGALLDALGLTNAAAHTAVGDARATAAAACELLNRAADAGHDHLGRLLAELGDGRSSTLVFSGPGRRRLSDEPDLSPEHLATHAAILPARPGKRVRAAWLAAVDECAVLRCDLLDDRVSSALMPADALLVALLDRLRVMAASGGPAASGVMAASGVTAASGGPAASATLLGAMLPLLPSLPPSSFGQRAIARRQAAIELDRDLGPVLDARGRCAESDLCPACRRGEPCPLDVWRLALAPALFSGAINRSQAKGYLSTTGADAGTGAYNTICNAGRPRLADTGMRLLHRHWVAADQPSIAAALARHAVELGCLDPEVAEARALALAAAGRKDDIEAAVAVCARVLGARAESTDEAWRSLDVYAASLGGRLRRLGASYTDERDAQGNLIAKRRHHPAVPVRSRPLRFRPIVHG